MTMSAHGVRRRLTKTVLAAVTAFTMLTGTAVAAFADTGIDVSRWQHGTSLNWSTVKATGVSFAFIKATEGGTYTNSYFGSDWAATRSVGIYHGAYHFARPSTVSGSAQSQARYFVSRAGLADMPGDLPPVLDLEATGGLGVSALRAWTASWLQTVEDLTGRAPMIYVSPSFWEDHLGNSTGFTHYPLWIANYGVSRPRVPGGWSTWTFWQNTSTGTVAGISGYVDMNKFNGARDRLDVLANVAVPASTTPTDPTVPVGPTTPTDPTVPVGPTTPTDPPPTVPVPVEAPVRPTTTTSLDASASSVYQGQNVTFSGALSTAGDPLPGRTVAVYRRASGTTSWTKVVSRRVDSAGHFAVALPVSAPASFKASFGGGTVYRRSTSPIRAVTIRVKTGSRVVLAAGSSSVHRGATVKLYGHLTTTSRTPVLGKRVKVYQRAYGASTWTYLASSTSVAPTGWYQAYVKPRRNTYYKTVFAGNIAYHAGTSNRIAVTVR